MQRVQLPYRASSSALDLWVDRDSIGIKFLGEKKVASAGAMARTFECQVVEWHVRVALLNRFTQLGRSTTAPVFAEAWLRPEFGLSRPFSGLCNQVLPSTPTEFL